jgi:hypothetical protein
VLVEVDVLGEVDVVVVCTHGENAVWQSAWADWAGA